MKTILSIMGTRPEIIKVAPVVRTLAQDPNFKSLILSTAQHREMSEQFFNEFHLAPDFDLDVMQPNQSLAYLTSQIGDRLDKILTDVKPDAVLVQGDTTTAFISGLTAFYHKIPVGHIEAGLRTFDKYFPFPEELNRQMLSRVSSLNFVPTRRARENLQKENVPDATIFYTGNTIVDALQYLIDNDAELSRLRQEPGDETLILVTAHRRENLGRPMDNICDALLEIVGRFDRCKVVFPVHPNPAVRETVFHKLQDNNRIDLIEPLDYKELIGYMIRSKLVLTDSGGIQEESPTVHKPVLVMRDETERPEVIEAGGAELVGTDKTRIVDSVSRLLTDEKMYSRMADIVNPFGDGLAARRIVDCLARYFKMTSTESVIPLEEYYSKIEAKFG